MGILRRLPLLWLLAMYGTIATRPLCAAVGDAAREYSLKAVFLYNICQFIEWPQAAFPAPNAPLIIGILGDNPFGGLLEQTVSGEVVRGHPVRIERYRQADDARRCHLLFIPESESGRAGGILAALRGRSIVTVGESGDFIDQGGMIALVSEENRVRLRIAPDRVRAANLAASSKLLRVADVRR